MPDIGPKLRYALEPVEPPKRELPNTAREATPRPPFFICWSVPILMGAGTLLPGGAAVGSVHAECLNVEETRPSTHNETYSQLSNFQSRVRGCGYYLISSYVGAMFTIALFSMELGVAPSKLCSGA